MGLAPHELLDDGFSPPACDTVVIGCGNLLRGDDALGPIAVRELWQHGVPDGVRLIDGGTAGMDVAFMMRGAGRVVIVDAARTGAEPGTVFRVPAAELTQLPPVESIHTHAFRWDHALAFGSWLLGPELPEKIEVWLVEAGSLEPGAPLTPAVQKGMRRVVAMIAAELCAAPAEAAGDH
ncbi:MAG: hydrogenase maturation protease [Actinomycetota bacterium]|nr:hydrogenase maturation protease [Actinomycetota bacterium]